MQNCGSARVIRTCWLLRALDLMRKDLRGKKRADLALAVKVFVRAHAASKQASKQARKDASKQASKQASKSPRAQHEAIIEV